MISFTQLHERLFMRGHTRGVDTDNMLFALEDRKISTVLNVALICDEELKAAMNVLGMEYIHEPLSDSKNIDEETVRALVRTVVSCVEHGRGVLVHCDSGRNRSALVAVPALAEITGRSTSEILTEVRQKRQIARGVLANRVFEKFVLEWTSGTPIQS